MADNPCRHKRCALETCRHLKDTELMSPAYMRKHRSKAWSPLGTYLANRAMRFLTFGPENYVKLETMQRRAPDFDTETLPELERCMKQIATGSEQSESRPLRQVPVPVIYTVMRILNCRIVSQSLIVKNRKFTDKLVCRLPSGKSQLRIYSRVILASYRKRPTKSSENS